MASEKANNKSGWFVLWGMLLLSIWMAPEPDSAKRLLVARGLLVLLALAAVTAAGLRLNAGEDRVRAHSGFVRAAGALLLAIGLWAANAPYVIETIALRATVLSAAGLCLLASLVLDLAREVPRRAAREPKEPAGFEPPPFETKTLYL